MTSKITIRDVMEYLFEDSPKDLPPDALGEVFDILLHCLRDVQELENVRVQWLLSDSKERVEIILEMKEPLPYLPNAKMDEVLRRIGDRWPELKERCEEVSRTGRRSAPRSPTQG